MTMYIKEILAAVVVAVVVAGCTLTGVHSGTATGNTASHVHDDHLGDPTFRYEVVDPEERRVPQGAVVSREPQAPPALEREETRRPQNSNFANGIELYNRGALRDARVMLTAALNDNLSKGEEVQALTALREINEQIFLSAGPMGDLKVYRVQPGDTLAKIASAHGTTWEMIQRINGLNTTRISVGQVLKVLSGRFELVVRKERFVMDLLLDGQFIQRYEVGLGVGGSTPMGEFRIQNRIPRPADGAYAYGHANHRLGTRWMGLEGQHGYQGYGIHGSRPDQEHQIPGECSQGCIRLTNSDVEEIFDIVPVGTRVTVVPR
jgi:hypothetical protein